MLSRSLVIRYCWEAFALVWLVGAIYTKPTLRGTNPGVRIASLATLLLGFFLMTSDWVPSWLLTRPLLVSPALQSTGVALTVIGCSFAIWARLALGRNWSGNPTVKSGHELVISGPYALTRHPIYTGMLVAVIGMTLADPRWRCMLGAILITLALLVKIRQEERLMIETFPETYPTYRRRVRALIPGLF